MLAGKVAIAQGVLHASQIGPQIERLRRHQRDRFERHGVLEGRCRSRSLLIYLPMRLTRGPSQMDVNAGALGAPQAS